MWDGHLGQVSVAEYRIVLAINYRRTTYFPPYQAKSTAGEFETAEIGKMIFQKAIQQS